MVLMTKAEVESYLGLRGFKVSGFGVWGSGFRILGFGFGVPAKYINKSSVRTISIRALQVE